MANKFKFKETGSLYGFQMVLTKTSVKHQISIKTILSFMVLLMSVILEKN